MIPLVTGTGAVTAVAKKKAPLLRLFSPITNELSRWSMILMKLRMMSSVAVTQDASCFLTLPRRSRSTLRENMPRRFGLPAEWGAVTKCLTTEEHSRGTEWTRTLN